MKYISLYPITLNKTNLKTTKIYTKHFLYFFGILEMSKLFSTNFKFVLNKVGFIRKIKKHNTQILRSPNRHKSAQFHVVQKKYQLHTSFIIRFNDNINFNKVPSILKLIEYYFLNFESSMLHSHNVSSEISNIFKITGVK